ncbi:thiamine phosphate synthase [Tepidibacter aestuarii]|uniref:thiamine phosphate synthase n=1 Tax=Tepidibacter aestuarii TaxID=2925782 RepID=UPI0020C0AB4E|nr:thiamine phosphate synthase [Tepidibacter aestuarii]CAH2212361.1 Thiamine-phosphate synthase [Tepidibacter aestuarii]
MNMLHLVTNRKLIPDGNILRVVEESVDAGIDAIILREKDLDYDTLYKMAKKIKIIADKKNVPLIVNGNLDVARDLKCHGFHIGFNCITNKLPIFDGIIGVSIHSVEEAIQAQNLGADYIIAGHIFVTDCKKGLKPRGIEFIKKLKQNIQIPIVSIGGINENNINTVYECGSSGVAIMSSIMKSDNIYDTIHNLK